MYDSPLPVSRLERFRTSSSQAYRLRWGKVLTQWFRTSQGFRGGSLRVHGQKFVPCRRKRSLYFDYIRRCTKSLWIGTINYRYTKARLHPPRQSWEKVTLSLPDKLGSPRGAVNPYRQHFIVYAPPGRPGSPTSLWRVSGIGWLPRSRVKWKDKDRKVLRTVHCRLDKCLLKISFYYHFSYSSKKF